METNTNCAQCGEVAFVANMHQNYDAELICHECFCGPAPDEAPTMPTVEEILDT